MTFEIGATVGPYQILEQLGQGGMATVYKAYHASLDRFVAIKVLHSAFLEDEGFLARFKREAKVVAQLDHPNIVPIYDFAEEKKQPYLIMKYIEGETLKACLLTNKLNSEQIITIAEKVGAALSYAHKKHIVHRDVKPSNVLFSKEDQIYLADFGLARIAQGPSSTLTTEQMIGTPQYISPEQALSQSDLDYHTDIYSFGVMLYEMYVGKVPFNADTPFAIVHDHIYSPLPLPRKVNPNVSEGVERVLLKALAKKPADRFESVEALVKGLKEAGRNSKLDITQDSTKMTRTIKSNTQSDIAESPPRIIPPAAVKREMPPLIADSPEIKTSTTPISRKKPKKVVGWIFGILGGLIVCFVLLFVARKWGQNLQQANHQATATVQSQIEVLPTKTFEGQYWQEQARAALEAYKNGNLDQYLESFTSTGDAWFYRDYLSQAKVFDFFYEQQAWVLACMVIKEPGAVFLQSDPFSNPHVHEAFFKAAGNDMPRAELLFTENINTFSLPSEIGLIRYNFLRGKFPNTDEVVRKLMNIKNDPERFRNYPEVDLLLIEVYEESAPDKVDQLINTILEDTNNIYDEWIEQLAKEKTNL